MKPWRLLGSSPTIWLTLDRLTQQAIWLLLFAILAPILGPKPYGLFTIVMAFIGFCEMVIVGGAVEALVTIPEATDSHFRTVNLAGVVAAAVAGGVVFAAAGPIANFFEAPELEQLFHVLAPLPVISALTAIPVAVLSRHMRFRALALRSIVGLVASAMIAVALAWYGAGVWALVAQVLAQRCIELAILWASAHTRLGFGWSQSNFRELRGYALNVIISKGMFWAGSQIPRIILGWYLGATDLGLFALAGRLIDITSQVFIVPRSAVARLTLRKFADAPAGFAEDFNLTIRQIAILCFPVCCGLAALMPILYAFLGQRWTSGHSAGTDYGANRNTSDILFLLHGRSFGATRTAVGFEKRGGDQCHHGGHDLTHGITRSRRRMRRHTCATRCDDAARAHDVTADHRYITDRRDLGPIADTGRCGRHGGNRRLCHSNDGAVL